MTPEDCYNERLIERFLSIDCSQISDFLKKSDIFISYWVGTLSGPFPAFLKAITDSIDIQDLSMTPEDCYNERLIERFLSIDCSQISDFLKKSDIFISYWVGALSGPFPAFLKAITDSIDVQDLSMTQEDCYNERLIERFLSIDVRKYPISLINRIFL
jgi:hypothetical protein